ncbi:MAG TPA: hypothetical protein EYO33_12270 [Phycisphaerales bacterium]|nr:hypothetical protein [Phycisphaerales bacterium]
MLVVRKTTQGLVAAVGSDRVVASCPLVAGAKVVSVSGELHVLGSEGVDTDNFSAYGISGELVPVMDADSQLSVDALWDNMVVKPGNPSTAAATASVDWDFDSADGDPDVEVGLADVNDLTGLLDPNKEIIPPTIEWLSFAKGTPVPVVAGTPDTYTPRSFKTFRGRGVTADMPSFALIAFSAPSLDETSATVETQTGDSKTWAILENLRNVMQDFWRINVGLIESNAESPYSDISSAVTNLVSPDSIAVAGMLVALEYRVLCTTTWVVDFPGTEVPNVLDGNNE